MDEQGRFCFVAGKMEAWSGEEGQGTGVDVDVASVLSQHPEFGLGSGVNETWRLMAWTLGGAEPGRLVDRAFGTWDRAPGRDRDPGVLMEHRDSMKLLHWSCLSQPCTSRS